MLKDEIELELENGPNSTRPTTILFWKLKLVQKKMAYWFISYGPSIMHPNPDFNTPLF